MKRSLKGWKVHLELLEIILLFSNAEFETLQTEVAAWVEERNQQQTWIDWRFTTAEARVKLKRLYPPIHT